MAINERFANHVQSIAFNLTLSRSMIEALGLIWHHGHIRDSVSEIVKRKDPAWQPSQYVSSHSVPIMNALERRGLMLYVPGPYGPKTPLAEILAHKLWQLTEAGEKVCELLVIAGLLEAKRPARARKAA